MKDLKKALNTLSWILVVVLGVAVFILIRKGMEATQAIEQYRQGEAVYVARVDSLWQAYYQAEGNVDTLYIEVEKWRTRYDTIIREIPLLPPTEQLALFDAHTGDLVRSKLSEGNISLVPLPRIEKALVLFTQRDQLEGEVLMLEQVIREKDGQISTLHAIIEQKDGIIRVRDAWIETIGRERKEVEQRLTITQWTAGFIIFLLTVVAISQ